MKEIALNDFYNIGKEVYKCVTMPKEACSSCEFLDKRECDNQNCTTGSRKDRTEVIFILYDTLEELEDE